jgi:hypothetical protein
MGSCLPAGDTSSDKTLQLSKICEELDKYYDTLTQDQESQTLLRNISSVLLAIKKIYDAEKDNLNDTEDCPGWHKEIIDTLRGNGDFDQKCIERLLQYDLKENAKDDAVEMFLDIYNALYSHFKEKNIFTKINNNEIKQQIDKTNVIKITTGDIEDFKKRKETQPQKDDKVEGNSNICLSDLVNDYFKKNGFALLKNRKYLVVDLEQKGDVLFENKDKTEVFEYSLQGGTVIKFVCSIFSNCNYFEKFNAFDKNIPKFLKANEDEINNSDQCKKSRVVCIFSLEKVSNAKLESLQEDE